MGRSISVIIPAHNEEATIIGVVQAAHARSDEVIVVDSCSSDRTSVNARIAGAKVVTASSLGKHHAIRTGVAAASGDILVFMDADIQNPWPDAVPKLAAAIESSDKVTIAKACYHRALNGLPDEGGRLTELCARPLLSLRFPNLARLRQPLAGEYAVRKTDIVDMRFAPGFAVDLGILLHCSMKGDVVEIDLGEKRHKHRSLQALGCAAVEVCAVLVPEAKGGTMVQPFFQFRGGVELISHVDTAFLPAISDWTVQLDH
jgi:glucosyl-3-phosphoglycerate synthase